MLQIVQEVVRLHVVGILHKSIKAENISIISDANGRLIAELADYRKFEQDNLDGLELLITPLECLDGAEYTEYGDIWQLGIVFL